LTSQLFGLKLSHKSDMRGMWSCNLRLMARTCFRRQGQAGFWHPVALMLLAVLWAGPRQALASAETDTNAPLSAAETNNQETLRAYLQLQEQLHLTQMAVEQNRREARETAAQSSELLAGRMQAIEKALESQRARELDAMQSSNRVMLTVAGSFATVGFLAILLMSLFQWRTVNRLADISAALPASLALGPAPNRHALTSPEGPLVTVGPAEQSNLRLLGSLEQLEKRILELEHGVRPPSHEGVPGVNGGKSVATLALESGGALVNGARPASNGPADAPTEADRVSVLLGKGQSMLSLDDARAAVACFDEVLALEPNNAEAWVRKGAALERLQQLDEAVECYDRAIASNGSLTIAYLHKGGLFNRMERFNEALECYEKALRSQEKRRG
jgi:tetratricopeptide (TPR) repeat protein